MIFSLPLFFRRRKRNVYAYWDGHRIREADPIVAWKIMHRQSDCNIEADLAATENGDLEALDRVVAMTRAMFELPVWSEADGGLTISETYLLLLDFLDFFARRTAKARQRPTTFRSGAPAAE